MRKRVRTLLAIGFVVELLVAAAVARAQPDCDALSDDDAYVPGALVGDDQWRAADLPEVGDVDQALAELDSSEGARVHAVDLDGDRKPESFVTSRESVCGTGGCPFVLLAASSMKRIGTFFGHLAILDERINGYRVIQTYSRYRGEATALDTHVFDGKAYRRVSHVVLEPCGFAQWSRRLKK